MINLREQFSIKIVNWQEELNADEWYFSEIEKELFSNLSQIDCFNLIPQLTELILEQIDEFLLVKHSSIC